jgi:hypothetical protein
VVADCDGLEEMKEFVLFDLRLLKQIFPMISTGPHPVVFSQEELRDLLVARQPFVFSFKAGFKMLYGHKEADFTLEYSLEHEFAYLGHLWTKFLILTTHDPESQYFSYLFNQIWKLMDDTESRVQGRTLDLDRTDKTVPALMFRIAAAYRAVFRHLHDFDPAGRVIVPPGKSAGQMLLINNTFLEDQPLDVLFSANTPGPVIRLEIIDREHLRGLGESDSLIKLVSDSCDAILVDGLIFPARPWDKLGLPILNPVANPLTFAELGDLLTSREPKAWHWEDLINALPEEYVPEPSMVLRNRAILDSLPNRLATIFSTPAADISFGICLFFVWNRLIKGEWSEDRGHSILSDGDMTNLRAIMACVDQQKYSEAFFKTRNCLSRSDPDPRKVAVSVLIPTHNRPILLRQALESIAGQTVQPVEVIVVDNGPDDDTRAVVDDFEKDYPCVRYVAEPNTGIPIARNRALVESSSDADVVAFMDDDCIADKNWLYELVLPFQYDPDVVSTGGAIQFNDGDRSFWGDFYFLREKRAPV